MPHILRSLLSSTDSCRNPAESGGIRRNPGNSRNSGGIKFGRGACQTDQLIPAEFRTEFKFRRNGSRNYPEGICPESGGTESLRNRCLSITSKSSVGVCRCSIWASSTNNPTLSQPPPSSTTTTHLAHHRHQWPAPTTTQSSQTPPTTSTARPNTTTMTQQRHVTTLSSQTSGWSAQRCHVAASDVANDERRHQSSFLVFILGEYSPPTSHCSIPSQEQGATSLLSATWQPNGERRLRSSFT